MKIFISGIAGFLGSHMASRLINEGHEVVGNDSLIGGYIDNVPKEATFYQYDCTNRNSMLKITKDVDVVLHAAATAYEGLSVFSPHFVTKNIFEATSSILSASIANKVKRFIFFSSMARYGSNNIPYNENQIPQPVDPYGIAKYAAELLVKNVCETHDTEYVIAVPHNIIGPRQKYDDPYRNVASIMINMILNNRQPYIYGDGNQKRCFSDIEDSIQLLNQLIHSDKANKMTINIGPDEEFITINELFNKISNMMGYNEEPIYLKDRPKEIKLAYCDSTLAREKFNYKTTVNLDDSIKNLIKYIKSSPKRDFKYFVDLEINNEQTPVSWSKKLFQK
ncbi:NAD-dependent epimerase/dehydratase family protein [Pelagibacteraceae bacterium]|nr:NAD-dependent epimerase/dehydratase family protein [Pelagibacteraceae bacterium]